MRRPDVAGVFGPAINDHLEAMLAKPLPPCEFTIDRQRCGAPSVAVLSVVCLGCDNARKGAACGTHVEAMRHEAANPGGYRCADCKGPIRVEGLS